MTKTFFLFSLLCYFLFTLNLNGQVGDSIQLNVGREVVKDGIWISINSNKDTISKGDYLNGEREGYWNHYCKHGYNNRKVLWKEGLCYDIFDYYYYNNNLSVIMKFDNGISEFDYLKIAEIFDDCQKRQVNEYRKFTSDRTIIHKGYLRKDIASTRSKVVMLRNFFSNDLYDSIVRYENERNNKLKELCLTFNIDCSIQFYYFGKNLSHYSKFKTGGDTYQAFYQYSTVLPYRLTTSQFFENGIKFGREIVQDKRNNRQECVSYHKTGIKKAVGVYEKGKNVGNWNYFDKNGSFIRTEYLDKKGKVYKIKTSKKIYFIHELDDYKL